MKSPDLSQTPLEVQFKLENTWDASRYMLWRLNHFLFVSLPLDSPEQFKAENLIKITIVKKKDGYANAAYL